MPDYHRRHRATVVETAGVVATGASDVPRKRHVQRCGGKGTPPSTRGAETAVTAVRGEAGATNSGSLAAKRGRAAGGNKNRRARDQSASRGRRHCPRGEGGGGAQTLTDELSAAEVIV